MVLKRLFLLAACLVCAACATSGGMPMPSVDEVEYRLGAGDRLDITVFREESLSGEYQVSDEGTIGLPLVGEVEAAGKTVPQFRADLLALIGSEYVRDPQITVSVKNFRPVYVLGEVNSPGEYAWSDNMTVYALVAKAGGFTYRANETVVFIRREGEAEETVYTVTSAGAVMPGDTVRFEARYF